MSVPFELIPPVVVDVAPHQLVLDLVHLLVVLHLGLLQLVEALVQLALRPDRSLVVPVLHKEALQVGPTRRREYTFNERGPPLEVRSRVGRHLVQSLPAKIIALRCIANVVF